MQAEATTRPDDLRRRLAELRAAEPGLRARDAASRLGITEAELVALSGRPLRADWGALFRRLPELGEVMVLTRNEWAVHEKTGRYEDVQVSDGPVGLVVGEAIDLRLFLTRWRHAYAVTETTKAGERHSIQVFDRDGTAVHKVYLTNRSDRDAFARLVEALHDSDVTGLPEVEPWPAAASPEPDAAIDVPGFVAAWDALEDTHDFHGLLRRFRVQRVQGLRLAGRERATPVAADSVRRVLTGAAETGLPIMVFVGNAGCIQIHTGPVRKLVETGPWYNVLDPGFNLHLREDAIATAWVVRKPTRDGTVTALELFDDAGRPIAALFGKRKPGEAEDLGWRRLVESLPTAGEVGACA
ncbi:hemin-degrading factor [Arenibaculum pallidiluteum]|uniref:hemin-degrading factor n=1 Tax=Arenibaculum pallidiluteum TaxID=2812559 RepID=UPI001A971BAE|nr:ChuX/HutX family heme-like substrate-binding protein [Arenibaculum pallidiluteum]